MGRQTDNRISYIRKPMAEHGYLCLGLAGVGLLLCVAGMAFSVRSQGNTPVGALSMCFSSILFSVASLMYGWKSFKEEGKKLYIRENWYDFVGASGHLVDCDDFDWHPGLRMNGFYAWLAWNAGPMERR